MFNPRSWHFILLFSPGIHRRCFPRCDWRDALFFFLWGRTMKSDVQP